MTNCDRYQEMISRMLDGDLSPKERAELAEHVKRCPDCAAVYVAFRSLSENLGQELEEVPGALHENIMADVRRESLRTKNSVHTRRRHWHTALTAAACLVVLVAAGLSLPKIAARKGLADQAAPAEAELFEESVTADSAVQNAYGLFETKKDADSALLPNAMPEMPAEAPAEAAAEEEPMEDYTDTEFLTLDKAQSAALEEIITGEKVSLDGSRPMREIHLSYQHEGASREMTVLLQDDLAVYVRNDGDSYCRLDASPDELLRLLGLDE